MKGIFDYLIANPILIFAIGGAVVVLVLGWGKGGAQSIDLSALLSSFATPAAATPAGVSSPARIPEILPVDVETSPQEGFKAAIRVAECLRQNGYPESEVETIVNSIAGKLLVKKAQ